MGGVRPPFDQQARDGGRASAWFYVALAGVGSLLVSLVAGTHLVLSVVIIPLVVAVSWSNPVGMLSLLPVWMVFLGFVRRFTPGGGNVAFSGDPVIIVGPIAILMLLLVVMSDKGVGKLTNLGRVVLAFNLLVLFEAVNPGQHSLMVGLGGILFILVPSLAFWIGRRYGTAEVMWRIAWTVALLSLGSAIYGLYQQFVGFPSWDVAWINQKGYTALSLGSGVIRAFGSFSSAQEYAAFLGVGLIVWLALLTRGSRWPLPLHVGAVVVVALALFYEGQRTEVFLAALALGVLLASRLRVRPLMIVLAGLLSVVTLVVFAGQLSGSSGSTNSSSAASVIANHQQQGLTDPLGANSSLPGHIKATRLGITSAFKHPLGSGSGSTTLAASRFVQRTSLHGTEFDPGNMGIAFGIPGLVIYILMVYRVMQVGYRFSQRRRDALGLVVIGIVMATLFQWTNGDLYSVCWLIWFFLGAADAAIEEHAADELIAPDVSSAGFTWRKPGEPRRTALS
jgi:hypothetical protein